MVPALRFPGYYGLLNQASLGDICEYRNGESYEGHVVPNGRYYLITLNSVDIDGHIKNDHKKIDQADWCLSKNDLIMVLSDVAHGYFLGLVDIIPEDNKYVLNQRMGLLRRVDSQTNVVFLRMYINKHQHYFRLHGQGSSQQNLSKGDIQKFPVYLPNITEQQKIAAFLSTIDSWLENLHSQKTALEDYKRGMMQKIFSQEIRFKDEHGNDYPEWEKRKIESFGTIVTGTTPTTRNSKYYGGSIPWVTPSDIDGHKDVFISNRTLTTDGLSRGRFITRNSLLITCIASIGKNAILRANGSCNQQINAITPNSSNSVDFLYYLFQQSKNTLIRYAGAGGLQILNKKDFSSIKLCIPTLEEQVAIAKFLSTFDKSIEFRQTQISLVEQWKRGLVQRMFV